MKERGLTPDAFTYTSLVCGYCKQGKVENAANLLEEMLEKGIIPDEPIAFSSFVWANMKSKQLDFNLIKTLL
ncbi:hypothetical protein IEQ34_009125 [Dendrobium chrysotoxum]|uniref:Pentatricopeptide repeat-containing protein n=1 Tax=Dendrobium chrysotoxum TaxID=161865 RepID=A0AAV7GIA8_DENCH|nr:hypothetical protein IEQ34_009125 [Dendrobium chrysotoxum]